MNETQFNADGHLSTNGVAAYADALRDNNIRSLPPRVREHVQDCEKCRAEVTGLFAVVLEIEREEAGSQSAARQSTWWQPWMRMAAAIAVLCGVGIVALLLIMRAPEHPPSHTGGGTGTTDTLLHHPHDTVQLIAARFDVSPELENLLLSGTRSDNTEVLAPINGREIAVGTVFIWQSSAAPPFRVTIVDNRNSIVKSTLVHSPKYVLADSLPTGLYYWKLIAGGDLLHVGKFTVR